MAGTQHIGLLTFAKDFAQAASATVNRKRVPPSLSLAGYYLIGHALELALKSALLLQGATEKDLRTIGHNLEEAARQFRETAQGSLLTPEVGVLVSLLNPYYSVKELEYFFRAKGMRLPGPVKALDELNTLVASLERDYRRRLRDAS